LRSAYFIEEMLTGLEWCPEFQVDKSRLLTDSFQQGLQALFFRFGAESSFPYRSVGEQQRTVDAQAKLGDGNLLHCIEPDFNNVDILFQWLDREDCPAGICHGDGNTDAGRSGGVVACLVSHLFLNLQ
jgi:hypothetical protein